MNKNKILIISILAIVLAAGGVTAFLLSNGQYGQKDAVAEVSANSQTSAASTESASSSGQGITINKADITENASFIPYQSGSIKMEVIAVKATDGTVRTVFNTCQVCFDSGRGYYKQEGNKLVCQNCGNSFTMDQVEKTKGGCNPVPILAADKTETDDTITIAVDVLAKNATLFSNWNK